MGSKTLTTTLFRTYDVFRKGRVRRYHDEARACNESLVPDTGSLSGYMERWGFDKQLERNPLMDKATLKVWINNADHRAVKTWAYTGGSYGEPLRIPYSEKRALIRTASILYFNELGGYALGDPYALIRAKDKARFVKFLRNEMIIVPYDTSPGRIRDMIRKLAKRRTLLLMGYPSVIYDMAIVLLDTPSLLRDLRIRNIITVSEPLESFKRQIIRDSFQCPLTDRYSNEEVGIIAQQKYPGEEYHVNRYGLFVEVVDPVTLQPVPEGFQGKVLVTDINNDLVPMIRYDTGDLATASRYSNGRPISISHVSGRVTEVITNPEGRPVSPLTIGPCIYKPLAKENKLVPYQFVQRGPAGYEVRLKAERSEISESLSETILKGLKELLGPGAEVSINIVADIACQPSGKRPVFKNEVSGASSGFEMQHKIYKQD
ncbi:MAG: hypothetical protein WAW07_10995 [Bacteroidales bacterium]